MMLQNFLAERFHLKLHIQSKEFPAYELVVAKSGPRLPTPAARSHAEDGWPDLPPNRPGMAANLSSVGGSLELIRLKAQQEPFSQLAGMLRVPDNLPVVNKTGLTGKFDFTLEYVTGLPDARLEGAAEPRPAPFLFEALEKQLGLQLIRKKAPFDVLIIDGFDKLPTEN